MQFHEMSYFSKYKLFKQSVSRIFGSLRYRWKYHSQTLTIPPSQVYPWTLRMIFPELSLHLNTVEKKEIIRLSKPHSLMWYHTPSFYPPLQAVTKSWVCVSAQGAVYLWRPVISLSVCVCVCDKISPTNTLDQMTRPHTLLSRTHYLSHTLIQDPAHLPWAQPPPTLIDQGVCWHVWCFIHLRFTVCLQSCGKGTDFMLIAFDETEPLFAGGGMNTFSSVGLTGLNRATPELVC